MARGFLSHRRVRTLAFLGMCAVLAPRIRAQEPPPKHHHLAESPLDAPASGWSWTADANVFVGYNYQSRLFADFSAFESQNWFMLSGTRTLGPGRVTVQGMLSLEPLTIGRFVYAGGTRVYGYSPSSERVPYGSSPQLFQTGESYQNAPLVNSQHPHDLLMGLGVTYGIQQPRLAFVFGADLVGSPTLGPTPFMHRESARDNPQVPLTHHDLDSTHITPGVLRAGVETGSMTFEASVFRGAEPDENRFNIETPGLDSWAARVGWHRGPWQAQFSGGRLHEPEWFEPYDQTRVTASIGFNGSVASRPLAATLAWGHHTEDDGFNDHADGYLLEWDLRASGRVTLYGRAEMSAKQIFGLGLHPKGFNHQHNYSHVDPLTLGVIRDLAPGRWGRLGLGADITVYRMSEDMIEYFDGSRSFHVFLRWRPVGGAAHVH
jgi:hypothetical protein